MKPDREDRIAALEAEVAKLKSLLCEFAVEHEDERMSYVTVQIDRDTWRELQALLPEERADLKAEPARWVPVSERMPSPEYWRSRPVPTLYLEGRLCTAGLGGEATHWLDGVPPPPEETER